MPRSLVMQITPTDFVIGLGKKMCWGAAKSSVLLAFSADSYMHPLLSMPGKQAHKTQGGKALENRMHMCFKVWSWLWGRVIWCWIRRCVSSEAMRSFLPLTSVKVLKPAQEIDSSLCLVVNVRPWSTAILLNFSLGIWSSDLKRIHECGAQASCHTEHGSFRAIPFSASLHVRKTKVYGW